MMMRMLHHVHFIMLYAFAHLLSKSSLTFAFLENDQIQQVVDFFQDTFRMHGGEEFLLRLDRGQDIHTNDFRDLDDIFGISCLLESLRPDIEGSSTTKVGAAPIPAYNSKILCIEPGPDCPEDEQVVFVDKLNATGNEFRYLGENDGGKNVQGVFWANSGTLTGSLLLSFAKSRDGGMISNGVWKADEEGIAYRLRPAGDRIWSIKGYNFYYISLTFLDLIYLLKTNKGTDKDPSSWKTIFTFSPNFIPLANMFRLHVGECLSWILDLDTYVVQNATFPNSVIWRRDTLLFGQEADSYDLVQIIDGRGRPIEPAYSAWVDSQRDPKKPSIPNGMIIETLDSYCDKVATCGED